MQRRAVSKLAKEKKAKPEETVEKTVKEEAAGQVNCEAQDTAEQKIQELEDKYLRLAAEYKNYQNRTQREKEALYTSAVADTVKELLPILDSMQRAEEAAKTATDVAGVAEGIAMISKMCAEVFTKMGVEEIEAVGKSFDATYHNAVMHIEDDTFGENEVVEEFQKGYKYKDSIIRYSMVKVAN